MAINKYRAVIIDIGKCDKGRGGMADFRQYQVIPCKTDAAMEIICSGGNALPAGIGVIRLLNCFYIGGEVAR